MVGAGGSEVCKALLGAGLRKGGGRARCRAAFVMLIPEQSTLLNLGSSIISH